MAVDVDCLPDWLMPGPNGGPLRMCRANVRAPSVSHVDRDADLDLCVRSVAGFVPVVGVAVASLLAVGAAVAAVVSPTARLRK